MNVEYVVRYCSELTAKPFQADKQNFNFILGSNHTKTIPKSEYFDDLFSWNEEEGCYYYTTVEVEMISITQVDELDYE